MWRNVAKQATLKSQSKSLNFPSIPRTYSFLGASKEPIFFEKLKFHSLNNTSPRLSFRAIGEISTHEDFMGKPGSIFLRNSESTNGNRRAGFCPRGYTLKARVTLFSTVSSDYGSCFLISFPFFLFKKELYNEEIFRRTILNPFFGTPNSSVLFSFFELRTESVTVSVMKQIRIHNTLEKTRKKKEKANDSKNGVEGESPAVMKEQENLRKKVTDLIIVKGKDDSKPWNPDARAKVCVLLGSRLIELLLQTKYGVIQCDPLVLKGLEKTARHMVIPYMPMLVFSCEVMIHIGLVFILTFKCARSARRQQMITWEKWRRRISAVKLRFLNLIVWQVITILIGKTTHALEYEEASMAASAIQPIAFKSDKLPSALVVNCPLGLRFLDTLSIYKNKRYKPVIAL
ncbi:hypothetical protein POTOM_055168 [Populus tomentosa]|uniref:Uncharacterized protein n=1 Tax=Populus tomentosa TaxID=118781 RepID=A0A8X7Y4N1_POPTO|nr:hypothetical protein POTOM_055168 [Populus tomentosa]